MITDRLNTALAPIGLTVRGAFHPPKTDEYLSNMDTLILIGNTGSAMWLNFSVHLPTDPNPLDMWTKSGLLPIAADFGADAVFPFDGPPYLPFQKWAMQADDVSPSPIGPLIHPVFGMWHAYRAAFLFKDRLEIPDIQRSSPPCNSCVDKPCLNTCPVGAFKPDAYDVPACRAHIGSEAGEDCLSEGCMARRACPIGRDYIYEAPQAAFHMRKFRDA